MRVFASLAKPRGIGGIADDEERRGGKDMASLLKSLEPSVGWRRHEILPDLEESPVPDRFRKKPSLDLRRSLRKRMPLRDVEINLNENPTWESLEAKEKQRNLKRTAKNVLGTVSQKIQDSCQGPARSLVASLAKIPSGGVRRLAKNRTTEPRTPRRRSIRRATVLTPGSGAKMVSPSGEETHQHRTNLLPLRRSARTSALRSPYASPVSISQRKRFDRDSERVSSGIRRLKRLSQAFNDIILQEERDQAILNYYQAMVQNMRNARRRSRGLSRLNLRRPTAKLRWVRTNRDTDPFHQ